MIIADVQGIPPEERDERTVADVMSTDLKTIPTDGTAMEAFTDIGRHEVGRLLATDLTVNSRD